jgi:phosphopentomutase
MRAFVITIDSLGIGALPDATVYGDIGSNTLLHLSQSIDGEKWPTLKSLGLGNAATLLEHNLSGCGRVSNPRAAFGIMAEKSPGKDTITGHWEIAGIILHEAFRTFPPAFPSFPDAMMDAFEAEIGRKVLGNKAASGTEIIAELGKEHMETGYPIVYTSADSVFQVAAHEDIIPVQELYRICETARKLCDPYRIARIIARPFIGTPGKFIRTERRHDFAMPPPERTLLDILQVAGVQTIGVGKIGDIFCQQGISETFPEKTNSTCIQKTLELMRAKTRQNQFVFVNFVDTDMLYGHRRDPKGYFEAVNVIDSVLQEMLQILGKQDLLIITADHGNDPTFRGTDHTREYVPLLVIKKGINPISLGIRTSFADVAQSVANFFGIPPLKNGISFL